MVERYVLDEADLMICLARLLVPPDGKQHSVDLKWKAVDNVLTVTLEVGPPKDDGKPSTVIGHVMVLGADKGEG